MPWTTDKDGKPVWVEKAAAGRELDQDILTKAKLQDVASSGIGSKAKAGAGPMPKQEAGEDAAAYGKRLREWREKSTAASPAPTSAAAQAGALRRKKE